jgi:hypothetical protein
MQETPPAIETINPPENPAEEVTIEAHPHEAPKEAHPEIITATTEQTEDAADTPTAAEASSEENSDSQNS